MDDLNEWPSTERTNRRHRTATVPSIGLPILHCHPEARQANARPLGFTSLADWAPPIKSKPISIVCAFICEPVVYQVAKRVRHASHLFLLVLPLPNVHTYSSEYAARLVRYVVVECSGEPVSENNKKCDVRLFDYVST